MTDWLDLAMTYGGFTALDKTYLETVLSEMTDADKNRFLTPPPSVVNAYFAEYYQTQSPQRATAYYLELCRAFACFSDKVSFTHELFPFIRLNVDGKAYGFTYENASERARVFAEEAHPITSQTLVSLAKIFPHYQVFQIADKISMAPLVFEGECLSERFCEAFPLTKIAHYDGFIRLSGYHHDEVLELAGTYQGQAYYHYQDRQLVVTITVESDMTNLDRI